MATTYTPQPGTVAYRILAWLDAEGKTAERNSSQIAHAMGIETNGIPALLEQALAAHLVFRRQKDRTHPRAPFWYSLTNHGVRQRMEMSPNPVGWMKRPKDDEAPAFRERGTGETDTPQGDQAGSEPAREVMEPAACESAAGRGTNGAPALATLPLHASPGVGPMGAGQPADAGPTEDDESAAQQGNLNPVTDAVEPAAPAALPLHEQPREVDAQFAATLAAAMDHDGDHLPPADLSATRRAVHAPRVGYDEHGGKRYCRECGQLENQPHLSKCSLAFRAARFTDGSLHFERHGQVIASLSAAEVDVLVRLLGARA